MPVVPSVRCGWIEISPAPVAAFDLASCPLDRTLAETLRRLAAHAGSLTSGEPCAEATLVESASPRWTLASLSAAPARFRIECLAADTDALRESLRVEYALLKRQAAAAVQR